MNVKKHERAYKVRQANQLHRTIGPTVSYLRSLRSQMDKNGFGYDDSFYRAVSNAYDELNRLFIKSFITTALPADEVEAPSKHVA